MSFFSSIAPNYGVNEFLLYGGGVVTFLVFQRLTLSAAHKEVLINGILAVGVVSTLAGIFYYLNLNFNRFTGSFINPAESYNGFPNAYAEFILMIAPLAVYCFSKAVRRGARVLYGAIFTLLTAGFALTFSRGAWASAAGVLGLFIVWTVWKKLFLSSNFRKKFAMITLAFVAGLILAGGLHYARGLNYEINLFSEKISFSADEGASSGLERIEFWKASLAIIRDNPFFGAGPGTFKFVYPQYQKTFGALTDHPHNVFLKIGAENGVIAVGLFGLFLLATLFLALRGGLFMTPLFFGATGALAHNLIDYNLNFASTALLLWMFLGILMNEARVKRAGEIKLPKILATLSIGGLIFLGITAHETYYNKIFRDGRVLLEEGDFAGAVEKLEVARALIWERDLPLSLAQAYEGLGDKDRAATALEDAFAKGIRIAAYENYYGELTGDSKGFKYALDLDSKNNLRYHYNAAVAIGYNPVAMENLLDEYTTRLGRNEHLTILTENPQYAGKLYDWLIENSESEGTPPDKIAELKEKKNTFEHIWFEENVKFNVRYK